MIWIWMNGVSIFFIHFNFWVENWCLLLDWLFKMRFLLLSQMGQRFFLTYSSLVVVVCHFTAKECFDWLIFFFVLANFISISGGCRSQACQVHHIVWFIMMMMMWMRIVRMVVMQKDAKSNKQLPGLDRTRYSCWHQSLGNKNGNGKWATDLIYSFKSNIKKKRIVIV